MTDVEKRLNSSLASLITQSKGSGTRSGKARLFTKSACQRTRGSHLCLIHLKMKFEVCKLSYFAKAQPFCQGA